MKKNRVFINLTSLLNWFDSPVGITRVQQEILTNSPSIQGVEIRFITFNKDKKRFAILRKEYFEAHLFIINLLSKKLFPAIIRKISKKIYRVTQSSILNILFCKNSFAMIFKSTDVLLSGGFDWNDVDYDEIRNAKKLTGFTFACISYDIIPITNPEFSPSKEYTDNFRNYTQKMKLTADKIICISDYVKNTLIDNLGILDGGSIVAVPLASFSLKNLINMNCTQIRGFDINHPYMIYISSLDVRKNHDILIEAYHEAKIQGINLPRMLFIGKHGNAASYIVQKIRNYSLNDKIFIVDGADDNEVALALANSDFAVYPSFVEGWGLGATEAITHGKVCVISTAQSLLEATNYLMPALDPHDKMLWMRELDRLSNDPTYKSRIEKDLLKAKKIRSWNDFTTEAINFATLNNINNNALSRDNF